jgi:hypothetical protein
MANGFYGGMKHKVYEQEAAGVVNLNLRTDKTNTLLNYGGRYEQMGATLDSWTGLGGTTGLNRYPIPIF